VGGKGGGGGRGEKWPKHCMHIWIIKKCLKIVNRGPNGHNVLEFPFLVFLPIQQTYLNGPWLLLAIGP
jgi:hypothetical protein